MPVRPYRRRYLALRLEGSRPEEGEELLALVLDALVELFGESGAAGARLKLIEYDAGRGLAIGMGLYGLLSMQFLLVFIAFFVYLGATQEGQAAMGRSLTHGMPVRAAMMTKFHTLSHANTIGEAAQLMLDTGQQDFPVLHGDQVIGLLDRNALLRAMAKSGADAYVAGAMNRDPVRLSPHLDLAEALPLVAAAGSCALVMDGDKLVGMLTRENLTEFLVLRRVGMSIYRSDILEDCIGFFRFF